eukprot:69245_1
MATRKPRMRPKMDRIRSRRRSLLGSSGGPPFRHDYMVGARIIHHGEFGKVYRCKRKKDHRILAVKCIRKSIFYRLDRTYNRRQSLLIAMQGEIDIMKRLKHKYIMNIEDCYEDKHTLYIVSEEANGGTLLARVIQKQRYSETAAKHIIQQILETLFYMHEYHRVVHCDLTPSNILFVNNRNNSNIKISDFGMSKVLPRLRCRNLQKFTDNMYYTAPEIIKGDYSHSCDIWSVGCIMFFMLVGYPQFYLHHECNQYFGKMENNKISQLILNGYKSPVLNVIDANTELLVFGFIRNQQNIFDRLHANTIFYNIAPIIVHQIVLFCNDPISDTAYQFMDSLMEYETGKRLTAKEALLHTWIRSSNNEENNIDSCYNFSSEVNRYQHTYFGDMTLFKYAICGLFEDNFKKLKAKHFKILKDAFTNMDLKGEGMIDYISLKKGLLQLNDLNFNEKDIDKWFIELDIARVGPIYFNELLLALINDYMIAIDSRLYDAFCELDEHQDGKIKVDALKSKIKELNVYENIPEIFNMIEYINLNNNGCIDYEEFLRCLHPDFNCNEMPKWFQMN